MAANFKYGSFQVSTDAAGNDQSITGVGFQPGAVLFWFKSGGTAADTIQYSWSHTDRCFGMGFAVSSTERAVMAIASRDDAGTTSEDFDRRETACIVDLDSGAVNLGRMDFKSMDADGFTLTIDTQFVRGQGVMVSYLAINSEVLDGQHIGSFNRTAGDGTGNQSVTDPGFTPDLVTLINSRGSSNPSTAAGSGIGFGAFTTTEQCTTSMLARDGQPAADSYRYTYSGECISNFHQSGDILGRASFVSMDANGFTVNWDEMPTNGDTYVYYLALDFVAGANVYIGNFSTRTDGNDISVTDPGFTPEAIVFVGHNQTESTQDTKQSSMNFSFGAATSTSERGCMLYGNKDNADPTQLGMGFYESACVIQCNFGTETGIESACDLKSMDAAGFTVVMDDTDWQANFVWYIAISIGGGVFVQPIMVW